MKKIILTFGLIAFLGISATSCSTDDSALETAATSTGTGSGTDGSTDNGDKELPKPPHRP